MKFEDFVSRFNGKFLDYDKAYGCQCVDLIKQYVRDVLGVLPWTGNAKDYWENAPSQFKRIKRTNTNKPDKGDIVVWNGEFGRKRGGPPTVGHVAIALGSGDHKNFVSFDQNCPYNTPCHKQSHNYDHVIGWLRKK